MPANVGSQLRDRMKQAMGLRKRKATFHLGDHRETEQHCLS